MRGKYIIGTIFIVLGLGFFFDQFGFYNFSQFIGDWWPLILVLIGVTRLTHSPHSYFWSLVLIGLGIFLIANNLGVIPGGFWRSFFPLLFIFLGLGILTSKYRGHNRHQTFVKDRFDFFTLFSGLSEKIESDNFQGGAVSVMFGGAEIDLRNAIIPPEGAIIDVSCAFGGVELIVPQNWRVQTNGTPILGALENKTIQNFNNEKDGSFEDAPLLKVNYFVIFGGIEIKNLKKKDYYHHHYKSWKYE